MACGGGFNDRDQLARNRDAALALEAGAVRWFFHLIATAASGLKVRGRTLATSAMSATFVRNRYGADTADGLTEFGKGLYGDVESYVPSVVNAPNANAYTLPLLSASLNWTVSTGPLAGDKKTAGTIVETSQSVQELS